MLTESQIVTDRSVTRRPEVRSSANQAMSAAFEHEVAGAVLPYERNAEIFGEDEPAEYFYEVVRGAVRTYRILSDGRRQVCGFYLPGEVFGLEAGEEHSCSAEAIANSSIMLIRRSSVMAVAARDHGFANTLWRLTARELKQAQSHALLLIKSARERVAAFLLEMAARLTPDGAIELPMSRQDIADYLGLTIETVSRTLTQFSSACAIELPASRRIVLRNRAALARLNS